MASDSSLSARLQLFGETLLGQQLRDLRSVLKMLRARKEIDPQRIALWGDSLATPNAPELNFKVPRNVEEWPRGPEPLGGLLANLAALFEEDIRALYIAGGLLNYHDALRHFAVLIPPNCCVPGTLSAGDLSDLAGSFAPKPMRLEAMADHLNRAVTTAEFQRSFAPAFQSYKNTPAAISFSEDRTSAATWLIKQLQ